MSAYPSKSQQASSLLQKPQDITFLPMGGCGEIGMNANFYGCEDQWILVDNGVSFSRSPDMVVMSDIRSFISAIRPDQLKGVFVTHAHEDHVGAVAYLLKYYAQCPIYATPFTAYILHQKLKEVGSNVQVQEVPLGGRAQAGIFNVEFVALTHSVPEPNALMIRTPKGNVFHTGDWKIDPNPIIGQKIDVDYLKRLGDEGVLALVCDSTNVFEPGSSGSEGDVEHAILDVVKQCTGRVVLSCFSSNLARIHSCYKAAQATNRRVCLVGRSLQRMVEAARHCGYFPASMEFPDVKEVSKLAPESAMILTTGSQAEPRAALTLMSKSEHSLVKLGSHDTVIFSSRVIPGNQEAISALQNRLVLQNVNMITYKEGLHVSGHPCRDELQSIYQWLRPHIVVPVHGEAMHLKEHAEFAKECGVPKSVTPQNGQIIELSQQGGMVKGTVATGRLALDGRRLVNYEGEVVSQRRQLLDRGALFVTLVISGKSQRILSRTVMSYGVFEHKEERDHMEGEIKALVTEVYGTALSQGALAARGKKPGRTVSADARDDSEGTMGAAPPIVAASSSRPLHRVASQKIQDLFGRKWNTKPVVRVHDVWV